MYSVQKSILSVVVMGGPAKFGSKKIQKQRTSKSLITIEFKKSITVTTTSTIAFEPFDDKVGKILRRKFNLRV